MTQGDGMAEVTEADQEKAAEVLDACGVRHEFVPAFVAGIAAALAEEREKARAPFRDLVTFYDRHEYSTLNVDDLRQILEVAE